MGPEWCARSRRDRPPEEGRGRPAPHAVPLVGPLVVVEVQEGVETALQSRAAGEVAPAEGATRQCSCRMVPCNRSTKPFVHAWRGLVRVWEAPAPRRDEKRCRGRARLDDVRRVRRKSHARSSGLIGCRLTSPGKVLNDHLLALHRRRPVVLCVSNPSRRYLVSPGPSVQLV